MGTRGTGTGLVQAQVQVQVQVQVCYGGKFTVWSAGSLCFTFWLFYYTAAGTHKPVREFVGDPYADYSSVGLLLTHDSAVCPGNNPYQQPITAFYR
jgi:hypothetical protein